MSFLVLSTLSTTPLNFSNLGAVGAAEAGDYCSTAMAAGTKITEKVKIIAIYIALFMPSPPFS